MLISQNNLIEDHFSPERKADVSPPTPFQGAALQPPPKQLHRSSCLGNIGTCPLGFISSTGGGFKRSAVEVSYGAQTLAVSSVLSALRSMRTQQPRSHRCVWTPACASALLQMFSDGLLTEVNWLNVPEVWVAPTTPPVAAGSWEQANRTLSCIHGATFHNPVSTSSHLLNVTALIFSVFSVAGR